MVFFSCSLHTSFAMEESWLRKSMLSSLMSSFDEEWMRDSAGSFSIMSCFTGATPKESGNATLSKDSLTPGQGNVWINPKEAARLIVLRHAILTVGGRLLVLAFLLAALVVAIVVSVVEVPVRVGSASLVTRVPIAARLVARKGLTEGPLRVSLLLVHLAVFCGLLAVVHCVSGLGRAKALVVHGHRGGGVSKLIERLSPRRLLYYTK